jgi:hypothetical protein
MLLRSGYSQGEIHIRRQELVQHVRQPVRLRSEGFPRRQPVRNLDNNVTAKED